MTDEKAEAVPHPSLVAAQRFFARLRSFDLECPHCGVVYQVTRTTPPGTWNPRTARFQCRGRGGCGKVYVLGLLAWPTQRGGDKLRNTPPRDQVPGPRQLAQLRQEGEGWWMPDEYAQVGRPDTTNLTMEPERPEPEDRHELELADADADLPEVRHMACKHCGQDIEGIAPFLEWRDRGNNTHCPTPAGDAGQEHEPWVQP